jgi:hypothetical protein
MTQRCVDIVRANATSSNYVLWIEQNFGRHSSGGSVGPDLYIGDAYTDGLSLDFYDIHPPEPITNEASMDNYLTDTSGTSAIYKEADGVTPLPGCRGPQTWFEFAKSRGKLISVGEWGLKLASEYPGGENDNPAFIEGVFDFFTKYAANISYENYFTQSDSQFTNFPESAAKYGQLWGSLA